MIYLDSSALVKLVFVEAETAALREWLNPRPDPRISSELTRIEVTRTTRRLDGSVLPRARALLDGLSLIPIGATIVRDAGDVGTPLLRSLDAIHLASALSVRADLSAFVAYDTRLVEAAEDSGLVALSPGT